MPETLTQSIADPRLSLWLEPIALELAWKNPAENLRRIRIAIEACLKARPEIPSEERLFVFPELTLTGFVTKDPHLDALTRDSVSVQGLSALAREFEVALIAGFPEAKGFECPSRAPRNTLLGFGSKGELFGDYQKLHLFTAGKPSESETYERGDHPQLVEYRGWKLGLGICFDLRFPELFQAYANAGADAMILPACWVGGPTKSQQFESLIRGHAILTQSFFLGVSCSGRDPNFSYGGEAFFFGPRGESYEGKGPFHLESEVLDQARALPVRASRRSQYEIRGK